MACTLSNKCAKNLSKRTVLLQLIIKNVVTCFFGTQCIHLYTVTWLLTGTGHHSARQTLRAVKESSGPASTVQSTVLRGERAMPAACTCHVLPLQLLLSVEMDL